MVEYATISVPKEVKRKLEKAKGKEDWGSFLLRIYEEYERLKRLEAFKELKNLLSQEELDTILKESEEFRKRFNLGGRGS